MTTLIAILHVLISLFIIGVVLLQSGKGAEMGASFGSGGSQSVFGAGGGGNFMTKLTTAAAIIFMLTSLTLAYLSGHMPASSIMSGKQSQKPAPVSPVKPMPAAPTAPVSPVK
ncbi:preprotein translocase subunit SecG [Trichlorobacter lovleyi]|uniref:preprotein translocase subunit SecG n=1 Tax=Trichlorobacter lovleyi TaxID=313985 RepID=UPI00223EBD06|nr:preprotein translocase subunit SecG [Trichlorobacter lovleyi]QOX78633.1 preprotein translocase subunit SecG [Trichlorobacter lovleyi]